MSESKGEFFCSKTWILLFLFIEILIHLSLCKIWLLFFIGVLLFLFNIYIFICPVRITLFLRCWLRAFYFNISGLLLLHFTRSFIFNKLLCLLFLLLFHFLSLNFRSLLNFHFFLIIYCFVFFHFVLGLSTNLLLRLRSFFLNSILEQNTV